MVRPSPVRGGARRHLCAERGPVGSTPVLVRSRTPRESTAGNVTLSPYLSVRSGNVDWIWLYRQLDRTGRKQAVRAEAGSFRLRKRADRPKDARGEAHHGRSDHHVGRQRHVRRQRRRRSRLVHSAQAAGGASGRRAWDGGGTASGRAPSGPQGRGSGEQKASAHGEFGTFDSTGLNDAGDSSGLTDSARLTDSERRQCRVPSGRARSSAGHSAGTAANTVGRDRPAALNSRPALTPRPALNSRPAHGSCRSRASSAPASRTAARRTRSDRRPGCPGSSCGPGRPRACARPAFVRPRH